MQNSKENAVRIFDLLPEASVNSTSFTNEFNKIPLYTIVGEGVLKSNPGIKRRDENLFYDVSEASQELKDAYADSIVEYQVKKVVNSLSSKQKSNNQVAGKIISVLSLLGEYQNLTALERDQVGHDYVTLESTEEGIKVKPLITLKGNDCPGNTYLLVDPSTLLPDLQAKLAGDTTELIQMHNGLFEQKGALEQQKEL